MRVAAPGPCLLRISNITGVSGHAPLQGVFIYPLKYSRVYSHPKETENSGCIIGVVRFFRIEIGLVLKQLAAYSS